MSKPFLTKHPFVVGLLFASVVTFAVWVGNLIQGAERTHLFRARAIRDLGLVQQQLRAMESGVYAVQGLYRSSEQVTEWEFRAFANSVLEREPGLNALFHAQPSLPDSKPFVAYSSASSPISINFKALAANLKQPHVAFAAETPSLAADSVVLLIPLEANKGVIGGIFSMERALLATNRPQIETWSSIEVQNPEDRAAVLASVHRADSTLELSEQVEVLVADATLNLIAKPTKRFSIDSNKHLPLGMGVFAGLLYALILMRYGANRERSQAASNLRAVQAALPLPWARFNQQLELVQWNQPFAELLEFDPDVDERWSLGIDSQNLERLRSTMREALKTGAVHQIELARYNNAGDKNSLLAIARAGSIGDPTRGLQVVWMDSTETRRLEEKLWRAQKLDAVGQLAGGIAHDFNNALTAISGYSSIVLSSLDPNTPVYEDVERILAASHRAAGLTTRLLSITRNHEGHRSPTNVNDVLQQTIKLARSSLGDNIKLALDLAPNLPSAYADPVQIEHLLLNLLFNARDAMPNGGVIAVSTEFKQFDSPNGTAVLQPRSGPYVVFVVGDTGEGIAPKNLPQIFEPLYTTKQFGRGTGLGLSMVRSVVASHEGGLWCFSEVGVGTTIRIALPASSAPVTTVETAPLRGRESILVIDDQESICELTRRYLSNLGYQIETATHTTGALELARKQPFDLFLIDVLLQGASGTDLALELLAIQPNVPVLYMSGYSAKLLEERAALGTPLNVLSKPFSLAALAMAVREALTAESAFSNPERKES